MTADRRPLSTIDLAKTCHKIPALIAYRVRCGKSNCRCADGNGHGPYWFLRWRDRSGRHCRRYVRAADLETVRAIVSELRAERNTARREAGEARVWLRANARLLRELLADLGRLA